MQLIMKNYLKIIFIIFWGYTCASSQELNTIKDKNSYYFYYNHHTLSFKVMTSELSNRVYLSSFCLRDDRLLFSEFTHTQNQLINHLAKYIEPDQVELFKYISVRLYLNIENLQVDHAVVSVKEEKISPIQEKIIIRLLNKAFKVDFKSMSDIDFSSCPNISGIEWIVWSIPMVLNGKINQIPP